MSSTFPVSSLGKDSHTDQSPPIAACTSYHDYRDALAYAKLYKANYFHSPLSQGSKSRGESAACNAPEKMEAYIEREGEIKGRADQDHPVESLFLSPENPTLPPLVLIGGMGPLAGVDGFERACRKYKNHRPILLYQATHIPCRTTKIMKRPSQDQPSAEGLSVALADAVKKAIALTGDSPDAVEMLLLCNTASYFTTDPYAPCLNADAEENHRPSSGVGTLLEPLLEFVSGRKDKTCLLLSTTGLSASGFYSRNLREKGLKVLEPEEGQQELLMRAIYQGIKAGDEDVALSSGGIFFQLLLRQDTPYDFVICACTEIPLIIDLLRKKGGPEIVSLLKQVFFVDPVKLYFNGKP